MRTSQRVLTTGIVVTAIAGSYAGATAATRPAKAASATFGTPVVVDHFRPGYEPDLAVAKAGAYKGSTFASVPNGFSTTMSYIWRSDNNRRSFHMVEGNALGKSTTCVGGGDSEMQIDPVNGSVYFNDLQGLPNFSNSRSDDGGHTWQTSCTSVPGAGVDRQWLAIDSNGGTPAGGSGANERRPYFDHNNSKQDPVPQRPQPARHGRVGGRRPLRRRVPGRQPARSGRPAERVPAAARGDQLRRGHSGQRRRQQRQGQQVPAPRLCDPHDRGRCRGDRVLLQRQGGRQDGRDRRQRLHRP